MTERKLIDELCEKGDSECIRELQKHCPDLDEECLSELSQMDYFLVGRENYNLPRKKKD